MTTQESNERSTNSRKRIIRMVKTPMAFFACILLVVAGMLGILASLSEGANRTYLIIGMLALTFLLITILALLAFIRPEALSERGIALSANPAIRELSSRQSYLAAIIEQIDNAQEKIWVSVNTLKPSRTSKEIAQLQEKLGKAKADGIDVRLLAPSGSERIEAAFELSNQRGIPIKILTYLSVEDLRYLIVDRNLSIISLKSSEDQGTSTQGAIVRGEQLNRLLQTHFEQHWNQSSAMNYEAFLAFEVRKLLNSSEPLSRIAIADNLNIPVSEIDRTLRIQPAKVLFLLGRPGSGKSSTTKIIMEYLNSVGYSKYQFAVHNDYHRLFTKFKFDERQENFEPGPRGGFRVRNFAVLDESLREINKDIRNDLTKKQFIIVEFSRNQYVSAMKNFDSQIIKTCDIFYLKTDLSVCIQRNEQRPSKDDAQNRGFVPLDIMETYYSDDDADQLNKEFSQRMTQIDNRQNGEDTLTGKITEEISKRLVVWLQEKWSQTKSQ